MALIYGDAKWRPKKRKTRDELFSHRTGIRIRGSGEEYRPKTNHHYLADTNRQIPSLKTSESATTLPMPDRYDDPEMKLRELTAQKETAAKKKKVAIVCHKSGYQYLGDADPELLKQIGKKTA